MSLQYFQKSSTSEFYDKILMTIKKKLSSNGCYG